jgi:hypothetical protein
MYSYSIVKESLLVQIFYNDIKIDEVGPWESLESATSWAEIYVAYKDSGLPEPEVFQAVQ